MLVRGALTQSADTPTRLNDLDPNNCVVVIPCWASTRRGGRPGPPASTDALLAAARGKVLDMPDSHTDESCVLPAWQRYDGSLYRAVGSEILADLAASGRLIILSGGYGVLDGRDVIGQYNRLLKASDWPVGLLRRLSRFAPKNLAWTLSPSRARPPSTRKSFVALRGELAAGPRISSRFGMRAVSAPYLQPWVSRCAHSFAAVTFQLAPL